MHEEDERGDVANVGERNQDDGGDAACAGLSGVAVRAGDRQRDEDRPLEDRKNPARPKQELVRQGDVQADGDDHREGRRPPCFEWSRIRSCGLRFARGHRRGRYPTWLGDMTSNDIAVKAAKPWQAGGLWSDAS